MSRILAIDYGERRIGLAISDPLGITAQGLPTLDTKKTKDKISHIHGIIKERKVIKVVVGMPRHMNGRIGSQGDEVAKFIKELKSKTNLEVIAWDERLTSVLSLRSMREMGTKQKNKEAVDRISAILILQSYLDSLRKED
jgi:putative Holliday junction resolvase